MSTQTSIEWTEHTWNPTVGCSKISPGCKNCYAEVMARRLKAMGMPGYENGFRLALHPHKLQDPKKRRKPSMYFVNSMSDLFHDKVPFSFVHRVFEVIEETPWHGYQILTKRAKRAHDFFLDYIPPKNAWIGVTVENRKHGVPRIDILRYIPAAVRFLSVEPLLEDLGELNLEGIHWVIVGGESGHKARPMHEVWVQRIQEQCVSQNVPFFFKQWGAWGRDGVKRNKKANGRTLNGKIWSQMPVAATSKRCA